MLHSKFIFYCSSNTYNIKLKLITDYYPLRSNSIIITIENKNKTNIENKRIKFENSTIEDKDIDIIINPNSTKDIIIKQIKEYNKNNNKDIRNIFFSDVECIDPEMCDILRDVCAELDVNFFLYGRKNKIEKKELNIGSQRLIEISDKIVMLKTLSEKLIN